MSKTIKFQETGIHGLVFSDYYVLEENEVIELFRQHPPIGRNVFQDIENHRAFTIKVPSNEQITIMLIPDESSRKYLVQIIMPSGTELIIPKILKEYLSAKEPIKIEQKDG